MKTYERGKRLDPLVRDGGPLGRKPAQRGWRRADTALEEIDERRERAMREAGLNWQDVPKAGDE